MAANPYYKDKMITEIEYLTIHVTADEGRVWAYHLTTRSAICEHLLKKGLLEPEYSNEDGKMYNVTDFGFQKIKEYEKEYM